jgi:DNA polymerase-3 subunit alpha
LFDEVSTEVRRFARRPIEELMDSREPQLVAGIINDFRTINGQRGKLALFKLDDKSAVIEARADEALINAHKNLLKDDELIVVMGKVQPDRFSGGMQLTVTQIWDLEQARCRFGKYLRVAVGDRAPDVARMVKEFPARREITEQGELVRGLSIRLQVQRVLASDAPTSGDSPDEACAGAQAELHLGDDMRFYPTDAALAGWRAAAEQGRATIAYD